MCLILFSYRNHQDYPLIVAANRDEFYNRPSMAAHFWVDAPNILAGRDMEHGGTWLGVTRQGRFAALTNYRDPAANRPDRVSRGALTVEYLNGSMSPDEYIKSIRSEARRYNGFNLLVGDSGKLVNYSNRTDEAISVCPGIHGLSNHLLNTPWPKVERGKDLLQEAITSQFDDAKLFALLQNTQLPADSELPDTEVGLEWERVLAPIFIVAENYGTRAMTIVTFCHDGLIRFTERSRLDSGEWVNNSFQFISA